jgi:hypothetical protein
MKILIVGNSQLATHAKGDKGQEVSFLALVTKECQALGCEVKQSLHSGGLLRDVPADVFAKHDIVVVVFGINEVCPRPLSLWQIKMLEKTPGVFQNLVRRFVRKFRKSVLRVRDGLNLRTFKVPHDEFKKDIGAVRAMMSPATVIFADVPLLTDEQDRGVNWNFNRYIQEHNKWLWTQESREFQILRLSQACSQIGDNAFLPGEVHFTERAHIAIAEVLKKMIVKALKARNCVGA